MGWIIYPNNDVNSERKGVEVYPGIYRGFLGAS
jgi:hypothetical protein